MAITKRCIVSLRASGTIAAETANNITSTSTGTLSADLVDEDGGATGASLSCAHSNRTTDSGGGRSAGATTLDQQINAQGVYCHTAAQSGAPHEYTVTLPASHDNVRVRVYACTTYAGNEDLDVSVNVVTQNINATTNTTGAYLDWPDVTPSSDQITISAVNGAYPGSFYVYLNGFIIEPVSSGPSSSTLLATLIANEFTI